METITGENKSAVAAGWGKEDVRWEMSIRGGEGRQKKRGFLLVLARGRQLACLSDINFLLATAWKPLAS